MVDRVPSIYVEETIVGNGATSKPAFALRSNKLSKLAKAVARRDGFDLDQHPDLVETYEQAIRDSVYALLDDAMYELSVYGREGQSSDFVERVRLRALALRRVAEEAIA